ELTPQLSTSGVAMIHELAATHTWWEARSLCLAPEQAFLHLSSAVRTTTSPRKRCKRRTISYRTRPTSGKRRSFTAYITRRRRCFSWVRLLERITGNPTASNSTGRCCERTHNKRTAPG